MPDWDQAAVEVLATSVRLAMDPRRRRHGQGSRLGAGPGASLEFHDHRPYVPGDDLRHLDWGVLARSDQMMLRRYRIEVSPRVDVLLDASGSMAIDPAKNSLAWALADLLTHLARASGSRAQLWLMGERSRRIETATPGAWRQALAQTEADGAGGLLAEPLPDCGVGSDRIIISDGLIPAGGAAVVQRLGQRAGRMCLVQVLTRAEHEPPALGAVRLADLEGGARDLVIDEPACRAYRERLARHQAGWQQALAGRGGGLISCLAEDGLQTAVSQLVAAGVLEVSA